MPKLVERPKDVPESDYPDVQRVGDAHDDASALELVLFALGEGRSVRLDYRDPRGVECYGPDGCMVQSVNYCDGGWIVQVSDRDHRAKAAAAAGRLGSSSHEWITAERATDKKADAEAQRFVDEL